MKVLLVEDEKLLSDALCQILSKNHCETCPAYDGETGLDEALTGIYDVILLDIMLPGLDGLEVLRQIRAAGLSTPVMLLTAKGETGDKVRGLDCGADDYLAKPFASEELLARVRALCRRKGEIIADQALSFSDLTLDLSAYELVRGGLRVKLSNKELEMMKYFFLRPNMVINREELLTKLWGFEGAAGNNLEVYISFLRKKLLYLNAAAKIVCIRGVGYQMEGPTCSGS